MKIQITKNPIPVGYSWQPPTQVEVPDELGMQLIEDGFAVQIKEDVVQDTKQDKPARKPRASKKSSKGNA